MGIPNAESIDSFLKASSRPVLVDLFCKAGGASMGYHRAGFTIIGVDIEPQKNYPFEFVQADALDFLKQVGHCFPFYHASPPCQRHSKMTKRWGRENDHPDLIEPVRNLLQKLNTIYIIENVMGAPLIDPLMLCGTMFELQTKNGSQLRRHRLFESNVPIVAPGPCNHNKFSSIGVYGGGQHPERRRVPNTIGVYGQTGGSSSRDGLSFFTVQDRRDAMGISWMSSNELSQAIPPAYTEWLGMQIITSSPFDLL